MTKRCVQCDLIYDGKNTYKCVFCSSLLQDWNLETHQYVYDKPTSEGVSHE